MAQKMLPTPWGAQLKILKRPPQTLLTDIKSYRLAGPSYRSFLVILRSIYTDANFTTSALLPLYVTCKCDSLDLYLSMLRYNYIKKFSLSYRDSL